MQNLNFYIRGDLVISEYDNKIVDEGVLERKDFLTELLLKSKK